MHLGIPDAADEGIDIIGRRFAAGLVLACSEDATGDDERERRD
jgi:hypothetical protein